MTADGTSPFRLGPSPIVYDTPKDPPVEGPVEWCPKCRAEHETNAAHFYGVNA